MIINCSILHGTDLGLIEEGHLVIEDGLIVDVCDGFDSSASDLKGYLAVPAPINAHTHLGDSFAKDAACGLGLHEAVGRKGLKWRLYDGAKRGEVVSGMRLSAAYMLKCGTVSFSDFREGGRTGILDLKEAVKDLPVKPVVLGRDLSSDEYALCDGLGLNAYQLDQMPEKRDGKIVAVHAGEVPGEIGDALGCNPDVIVHFTHPTEEDIATASEKKISIVLCPRSNAALAVGFPPVRELFDAGINLALGTDNVMINTPNLWREMEYLFLSARLHGSVAPLDVLKMCTVNAARAYGLKSGVIGKGRPADIAFVDLSAQNLSGTRNIYAALACRTSQCNVRKVMSSGAFVVDKDR